MLQGAASQEQRWPQPPSGGKPLRRNNAEETFLPALKPTACAPDVPSGALSSPAAMAKFTRGRAGNHARKRRSSRLFGMVVVFPVCLSGFSGNPWGHHWPGHTAPASTSPAKSKKVGKVLNKPG